MNTIELMKEKLAALEPTVIRIADESARHAGHEGAKAGGGHYLLTIVSHQFIRKSSKFHKMHEGSFSVDRIKFLGSIRFYT